MRNRPALSVPTDLVLSILGDPPRADAVSAVTARVLDVGARVLHSEVLSGPGWSVVRMRLHGAPTAVQAALETPAGVRAESVALLPAVDWAQGPGLLVTDVDSTLIQDEVIDLLAAHAGRAEQVAAVTERAMRGELDFAASLHERVACLAGLPVGVLAEVGAAVRLSPGAETLCRTLRARGWTLAAVSGGFLEILQPLADRLGIQHARANRLETADGRLTGRVLGTVVDRAVKAATLHDLVAALGLPPDRSVALGDGANDLDLLAAAGLGIAYNAKPVLREAADAAIDLPALDAVLGLLGLPAE